MAFNFDITANTSPFANSMSTIRQTVKNTVNEIEKVGGNIDKIFDALSKGVNLSSFDSIGRQVNVLSNIFNNLIDNFGLSQKAAQDAKSKITSSLQAIAQSGDDASLKLAKLTEAYMNILSEAKQADFSLVKDDGGLKNLEDAGIAANILIDKFTALDKIVDDYATKIGGFKGGDFYNNKDEIYAYGEALEQAINGANEAYQAQEKYVNALEEELAKITEQINTTSDNNLIDELNKKAEELTPQLELARGSLEGLKEYIDNTKLRLADTEDIKETIEQLDDLKEKGHDIAEIFGDVKFNTDEANKAFEDYANKTTSLSEEVKGTLKTIATLAGIAFGVSEVKSFITSMAQTREEFQDIESSFKVFLGNEEKATSFVNELKDYAWYNMFEFKDLTKASQQMIAYGQDVDTIIEKLDMLSNIAAGTHAPLMEMVDAYNRAKSTGVVDANGIKSWATKGVVIKDVLKEMGETASTTSITFDQLNKVLEHLTGEGGMFHNLMAEQLSNISAEKGQLEDNLTNMFNEIGEKYQDVIIKWYKLQSDMVDNYKELAGGEETFDFTVNIAETGMDILMNNWKELITIIKNAIAIYGSWKVGMVAANAIRSAHIALLRAEVTARNINTGAIVSNTIAEGHATKAKVLLTNAQKAFNASLLASPYTWAAAAIAGLTFMTYKLVTADDAETAARKRATAAMEEWDNKLEEQKERANSHIATIKNENATELEKIRAYEALKKELPSLTEAYSLAELKEMELGETTKKVGETIDNIDYTHAKDEVEKWKNVLEEAKKREEEYRNSTTPDPNGKIGTRIKEAYVDAEEHYKEALARLNQLNDERNKIEEQKIATPLQDMEWTALLEQLANVRESAQATAETDATPKVEVDTTEKLEKALEDALKKIEELDDEYASPQTDQESINKAEEAAQEAIDRVMYLDTTNASPNVDSKKIDEAKTKIQQAIQNMDGLASTSANPKVVTTSIQSALDKVRELWGWLQKVAGRDVEEPKQNKTTPKGVTAQDNKEQEKKLLEAIKLKAKSANTAAKVKEALQAINTQLEKAEFGSQTEKDLVKLQKDLQGKTVKGREHESKSGAKTAKEQATRNAKELQEQWKHEEEMTNLTTEAARARENASIAAIKNQAERERVEREKQHERTIQDIKKQNTDIYKSIYEQRKRAWDNTHKNNPYENTEEGKLGYQSSKAQSSMRKSFTDEEKKYYDERNKIIESKLDEENAIYARYISERQKEQLQSMRDYIKEYGSVQEKIYVIEKEYDDKINEERDEYRKKSLKEEKKKALDTINVELLKTEIDWTMLFDGIGSALEDEMKATLDKVEKYMRTDSFKALDAKDKAEFVRMRNDLYSKTGAGVGTFNFSIYNQIAEDLDAYKTAIANHKQAVITHTEAVKRLSEIDKEVKDAEEKLKKAVSDEEKRKAETNLKYAQAKQKLQQNIVRGTKEQVTTTEGEVVVTRGNVEESSSKAIKALDNFGNALNQLNNGTLRGFADGLVNLINAIGGGKTNGLSGLGKVGGIIGAILSIIDALGDAPAQFFDDLFDKIATVLEAVIAQIPQIASSIIQGAGNVIGSVFTGVGDVVAGIFGGGEDWSAYDEALDKWGGILDRWKDNVDYERELMEKAYGVKAIEASQKAVDAAKNAEKAAKNIYIGWAGSGAGWFSHSNGYNVDNDVNWRLLYDYNQDLFNMVGEIQNEGHPWLERFTGDVTKFFDFTWQELEELKNRAPQFWNSIHSTAQEYLEQYIEAGKVAEETTNALNEQLTTTTKENVFSDFLSSLYDLADGAEDVTKDIADNWQKMVNRMVINNLIANDFQKDLKEWYEALVKLQKERTREENPIDNKAYQDRLNDLKKLYDDYFNEAQGKIQTFTELGIIKPIEDAANEVSGLAEDMSDSIQSAFSDLMGDPTQDVEEWGRKLRNSLIQQFVRAQLLGSEFEEWAKGIAERYNSAWEAYNGGGINAADLRGIMTYIDSEVDAYTEAISEKAKRLMEAFGYTPDTEELQSAFSGLRDTFLNTLTDIEGDAKAFRKNLEDIMVKDLIDKQVLDVPVTVNGMTFDDFNAYVTDWNERYSEAVKSGNQAAIDALLDELVQVREQTVKAAEELRERLKVNDTTFSTMSDSWVSTLMDMTKTGEDWAENIGKTMADKIIKEMLVTNAIQPLLDGLQNAFNVSMSQRNNGLIDFNNVLSSVAPELERIKAAFPGFQQVAKNIMNAFGLDTLTTEGFSNLSSSFLSALTDMEGDAAKFGKSIGVTMAEQMADEYINGKYGKQIDDANRRWREALENGDTTAMESIRSELESLYKTMADDSALKQFVDNIKQAQTEADTTFSDLTDSWVSQLMDFNGTAEDWAKNLGKTIAQKVIEQTVVGTMIQPLLDNLQNAVNNSLATFGNNYTAIMSDTSISDAVNALMANYPQIKELIESIMSAFGVHNIEENPFADLSNTLVSSLTDMNATAESFGKEIGHTLVSQMIAAIVEQRGFQGQIDALGEQWSHALETGDVAAIERIKIQLVEIRRQMGEAVQPLLDSISDMEREADTTFSSMTDSWVSALSDMSKTAEDWAQDVGGVMAEKIISQMIAPKYIQPLLDEMQKTYDAVIATPGVSVAMAISSMTPYLERIKSVYAEIQPMVTDIFGSFGIYADTTEEAFEEVNYALQDMKSNFVSALMDMTNSTEDFSKEISKTLAQTFIEKFVLGDKFDQQMEYWQQQYESIIGSGMSEDERKKQLRALRDAIATAKEGYVNSAMAVQELLGLTAEDTQEATMNMADKMTYDQADELLGINLAQELIQEQILAAITGNTSGIVPYSFPLSPADNDIQAAQIIATIHGLTDLTRMSTENMLQQVAVANSHLQLIRDYSKTIRDEVVMHLASMDSKLTNLRNL